MEQDKTSHIALFLQANFSIPKRAVFYSLPLIINWVIGIIYEKDKIAYESARRGFFLSMIFLFVNAVLFFANGFFQYFTKEVVQYIFFSLSSINILFYISVSIYISIKAWKGEGLSDSLIDKKSISFEKYLSR